MKNTCIVWPLLCATSAFAAMPADKPAEESFLNHLTVSGRFGLNVKANFGPRANSSGGLYNYIDGYVLPDSTGNFDPLGKLPGGITSYWGYDNSVRQVGPDQTYNSVTYPTIAMTRSAAGTDALGHSFDDDPRLGLELSYKRELGQRDKLHYGIEVALNYMNLCLKDDSSYTGNVTQDYYPYYPLPANNFPPEAGTPGFPGSFQGTFGPGNNYLLLGGAPIGSGPATATLAGRHQFDADIWGLRVGPYLQYPLGTNVDLNIIGGLAVALVDSSASWSESVTVGGVTDSPLSGQGDDRDLLWGYYVGLNLSWHLNQRWDLNGGVQFQDVGVYSSNVGNRSVELDMSESIYITVGLSYKF